MLMTIKNAARMTAAAAAALAMTACAGNSGQNVLKDSGLALDNVNGMNVVSWTSEIDSKNLIISAATLPILSHGKELGKVEILSDVTTQKTYMKVSFNIKGALDLPLPKYSSTLPNGTQIPLTGIDLNKMMSYEVGKAGSRLYLYYDKTTKKAVLGVALNVESLAIGTPANVMALFDFNGVTGVAGLYFGQAKNTSGLGAFVNLSSVFTGTASVHHEFSKASQAPVGFYPLELTPSQQNKVARKLWELSVSGEPIEIK